MRYALIQIEVTEPLGNLTLTSTDDGLGVLVRRKGVPIGFWMQPAEDVASMSTGALAQRIVADAGARMVAEAIREELIGSRPPYEWPVLTIAVCTKDRAEL